MSKRHDEPWTMLRDLEPPLGSQRRVLMQAQEATQAGTPRQRRWPLLAAITASVAVAVALLLILRSGGAVSPSQVAIVHADAAIAEESEHEVPAPQRPDIQDDVAELLVVADDELMIRLPKASITVSGPAAVKATTRGVKIREGRVKVAGFALVEGPACEVRIDGEAIVELVGEYLQTRMLSGTATTTNSSCRVIQAVLLIDRSKDKPVVAVEPKEPAVDAKEESSVVPTSMLRQQLDEFKSARILLSSDPRAALKDLRAFIAHWPDTMLREEAEAGMIEALLALGRKHEARRHIRTFEARYPLSQRTARMREQAQ